MKKFTRLLFGACALITLTLSGGDARAGAEERAARISQKAITALTQDYDAERAMKLAFKAIDKNPNDPDALGVLCVVLFSASMEADGVRRAELIGSGEVLFERLRATSPQSGWVALVGEVYVQAIGAGRAMLISSPEVRCPEEAVAAYDTAEERFARRDFTQAKPFYERAISLCPENPLYRVMYGDTFFMLGDIPTAREHYNTALEMDPHNWTALRFRADSYLKEGDYALARADAIRSVAANVNYAFGWNYLQGVQHSTGGAFHYLQFNKPKRLTNEAVGKPMVVDNSSAGLIRYQLAMLAMGSLPGDTSGAPDPMELERSVIRMTILSLHDEGPTVLDLPENTLWRLFAEADAAGYLDEAIFVLWLDEPLVPAYLAHREAHRDRLETYIGLYLAPAPPTP
jgi:tetratricopeptide (TPR) repeat protein